MTWRTTRSEAGATLIETLVAVAILSISVTGLVVAIITSLRASTEANINARLSALVTAYGEAIKDLPFEECPESPAVYEDLFEEVDPWGLRDRHQQPDREEVRLAEGATLSVVSVAPDYSSPACRTSGVQTLQLEAELAGRTRTAQIVKRNPNARFEPIAVTLHVTDNTPPNSLQNLFSVRAVVEPPEYNYIFRWFCNAPEDFEDLDVDPGPPETDFGDTVDCLYPSPVQGTNESRRIGVEVTGAQGQVRQMVTVDLHPTASGLRNPTVTIWAASEPKCSAWGECHQGQVVDFEALVTAPSGNIVRSQWRVSDGSVPRDCYGANCTTFSHEFEGGGEFHVVLQVWDSWGATATSNPVTIIISDPPRPKPTLVMTASSTFVLAKGSITFDASQSHGDGAPPGGGITEWIWNCGDGMQVAGSSVHQCTYNVPGQYTATLFVVAANGTTNVIEQQILVGQFAVTGQGGMTFMASGHGKGDIPFIRDAYIDFQWVNPNRAVGDVLQIEINISGKSGLCGVFGVGPDGKKFSTTLGAPGTPQTYRAQFRSTPRGFNGVCATDEFTYQARIIRTNNGVTDYSDWSNPVDIEIDFF